MYRDIPAPDVNTDAQVMAWFMDAYSSRHGYSPAAVTGKPVADTTIAHVPVSEDELLTLDCDILVPAALGGCSTATNAPHIQATVIAEGANHPITPAPDEILTDRGITIIPDILANGGGVTGSYFEWTQNIQQFHWKEDRFNTELRDRLERAFTVRIRSGRTRAW